MNKAIKLIIATSLVLASTTAKILAEEGHGNLTVKVTKLKNNNGNVRIAVYNSQDTYDAEKGGGDAEKACNKAVAEIKSNEAQTTFEKLPYGQYAVKFFHDEDKSGKFYKNFVGIPKVEYGFSNNARGRFGPAGYDQAKFNLDKPSMEMTIDAQ